MATIQKVSQYWRALFTGPEGNRICRSLKTSDRTLALKLAADLEYAARQARAGTLTTERGRAVLNEILIASGQTALDVQSTRDFLTRWLATKGRTKARGTAERYGTVIRAFLLCLGAVADRPLAAVLARHVEDYRDELMAAGKAVSSVRIEIKILGAAFAQAVRQGILSANPVSSVELDDSVGQTREPFTREEIDAMVKAAPTDWQTAILLGALAGLRIGDAVNLTWDAVDLTTGLLTFCPKKTARKGRILTVPLHPRILAHLESIAGDVGGQLCPALADRGTGGKTGLSRQFITIMEAAGIDREASKAKKNQARAVSGKSFHSLRHSFNTALLAAGVDEKTRMDLSGHASAAMNRKYSHSEFANLRDAVAKI